MRMELILFMILIWLLLVMIEVDNLTNDIPWLIHLIPN